MDGAQLAQVITSFATLCGVVGGIIVQIRSSARVDTKINDQHEIVKKLELNTNSIKDALVASTAKASNLEGQMQGRADVAQEAKAAAIIVPPSSPEKPP
jgi:hypothetical protein